MVKFGFIELKLNTNLWPTRGSSVSMALIVCMSWNGRHFWICRIMCSVYNHFNNSTIPFHGHTVKSIQRLYIPAQLWLFHTQMSHKSWQILGHCHSHPKLLLKQEHGFFDEGYLTRATECKIARKDIFILIHILV